MTSNKFSLLGSFFTTQAIAALTFIATGCGSVAPTSSTSTIVAPPAIPLTNGTTLPFQSGNNVMRVSVSAGPDCSINYINKPCVTVTICNADGSNCSAINDILLDTGSYGLRVFKSVLTSASITPTQVQVGGVNLAECIQYGDGSKQWGPVQTATVKLGNEPASVIPIQVIDSTFGGMSANCSGAVTTPTNAQFNGILGVGLFDQDCGSTCVTHSNNQMYYACTGSSCSGSTVPLASQVRNPVGALGVDGSYQDNNGVILQLPDLAFGGAVSSSGYLILGIGTRPNNMPTGVTAYTADSSYGEFTTTFAGHTYSSFIDSGSNSLAFPAAGSGVAACGSSYTGWYCPNPTATLSAVNHGYSGGTSGTINFYVEDFGVFWASPNYVIKELASGASGNISGLFDWGLPFHFGRNVYVGIKGKTSTLGTGPYWAY